jgi:glycosyltransferase involved in cell wall biosynthesis
MNYKNNSHPSVSSEYELVSALICSYNGHARIGKAIRSVLGQTYQNIELVVIDDGSEPSLKEAIATFCDERISFCRIEKNIGLHAARAFGVEKARGEFVALLDDDDYWLPQKIEKQVALMQAFPLTGLVCCGAVDIYPDGRRMLRLPPANIITYRKELVYEWTVASSVLFRRSAYERVGGFDGTLNRCGDWDCWIRLAREYSLRAILEPLVFTEMRDGSLQRSSDVESYAQDRFKILVKHREELVSQGLWNRALSWHLHSMGVRYLRMGLLSDARKHLVAAVLKRPHPETIVALASAWPWLSAYEPRLRILSRKLKSLKRSLMQWEKGRT